MAKLPPFSDESYTCSCGIYVHPSRRDYRAVHCSDCPYYVSMWYATDVHRPDAGRLFNAVRWVDGAMVEAPQTPTHDRELAEQYAKTLNEREVKP